MSLDLHVGLQCVVDAFEICFSERASPADTVLGSSEQMDGLVLLFVFVGDEMGGIL